MNSKVNVLSGWKTEEWLQVTPWTEQQGKWVYQAEKGKNDYK